MGALVCRRACRISLGAFVRSARAQAIVETALVLPFAVLLLIGVYEVSRVFHAAIVMQTAVQAGAQYGALSTTAAHDTAGIDAAVRAEVNLQQAGPTNPVVTSSVGTDGNGEELVTVRATFTVTTIFDYPGIPRTFAVGRVAALQVHR